MSVTHKREERWTSMLDAAIFAVITVIAGLVVCLIMQRQAEFILGATLELSLQSRVSLFEAGIGNKLDNTVTIATRPYITQQIKKLNQSPADELCIGRQERRDQRRGLSRSSGRGRLQTGR